MTVRRIVTNIATDRISDGHKFYGDLLGLEVVMDHGWIVTFASDQMAPVQVSVASEGGSGSPVPDISIEVDDVDEVYQRAQALGFDIAYPVADKPWGVRRFFVHDPFGKLVNIVSHTDQAICQSRERHRGKQTKDVFRRMPVRTHPLRGKRKAVISAPVFVPDVPDVVRRADHCLGRVSAGKVCLDRSGW